MRRTAEDGTRSTVPQALQGYQLQPFSSKSQHHSNKQSRLNFSPKSKHKKRQTSQLARETSSKHIKLEHDHLNEHYQNMQRILIEENLNLKEQNQYLTSEMRKSLRREEKWKESKEAFQAYIQESDTKIALLQRECTETKQLIEQQLEYLATGMNSSNLYEFKNVVWRFIDQLSNHLHLDALKIFPQPSVITSESQQSKVDLEQQIQLLTKKLEQLIQGNQNTVHTPAVRRQCIEISKQIKKLKEKSNALGEQSLPSPGRASTEERRVRTSLPVSHLRGHVDRADSMQRPSLSKISRRKSQNREIKGETLVAAMAQLGFS